MKKKNRPRAFWRVLRIAVYSSLALSIIFICALAGAFYYLYKHSPDVSDLPSKIEHQTSIVYDRSGTHVLYEIHGDEHRKLLTHDQIPNVVRESTVAAEDKNFYTHPGFDILAIIRAAKANYENSRITQGASTITQQLARNAYLTREKSFQRKVMEIILAVKIERTFSKDQILDMYLNKVSYGSNTYGIETASELYFRKPAKDLALDEAAFLAALPKAPSYYSPQGDNIQETVNRQKYILNRMELMKFITPDQDREAGQTDTIAKVQAPLAQIQAPHFVFYVIDQLKKQYGNEMVEEGGLKIITSLDYDLQQQAEKIVKEGAEKNLKLHNAENAALVAIDPKTGEILAMAGSRDFFDSKIDSQVNVATSLRQPGSAFKPIVYSQAFEYGYQPETPIYDVRTNFGPDGSGRDYIPRDYDGKFRGRIDMRRALAMSLNVPAVQTLYFVKINNVVNLAQRFGINSLDPNKKYGLSLALGSGEVTLLELTGAYTVFADDGVKIPTTPFYQIMDAKGKIIYQNPRQGTQIISNQTARKISSILSDTESRKPVFGTAPALTIPGRTVAVKTGTSQDYKNDWTVGYTPDITVGVWTGNNNNSPMKTGSAGAYVAAPIWKEFMQVALKDKPDKQFLAYQPVDGSHLAMVDASQDQILSRWNSPPPDFSNDKERAYYNYMQAKQNNNGDHHGHKKHH